MDAPKYNVSRFNSRRSPVMARNGMVAASQPLAAAAGLRMLLRGGNAVDAAVATAAALGVTEPHQTGLGGDAFALIYLAKESRVRALNASGIAPQAARLEDYLARGLTKIPMRSPLAWTVPGCLDGWQQMLDAHGTMTLAQVLEPAIEYAENGFPVSPVDVLSFVAAEQMLAADPGSRRSLLIDGRAPRPGDILVQKDLAQTLRKIAKGGPDLFYRGEIATKLVAYSETHGGLFTKEDFASYHATWEEPIAVDYHGYRVLECPPNGQGLAALLALRTVEEVDFSALPRDSAECWHLLIEAIKMGLTDAMAYVADPRIEKVPVEALLSDEYTAARRKAIRTGKAAAEVPPGVPPGYSNTVYMSVVDAEGNAVSFINSIYDDFGTGHTVEGLGFPMQNRGACFSLQPGHPNRVGPGKRPYHTIIPGMVLKDGQLYSSFGVMGGFMQPQGHLQVLVNLLDYGMDVQTAVDEPRFQWLEGRKVMLEDGLPEETYTTLESWGHLVDRRVHRGFGGAQVIVRQPGNGVLVAGSEPRQDGCAIGY